MGDMSHWGTTILANQHRNVTVVQKRAWYRKGLVKGQLVGFTNAHIYNFCWMATQCEDLTRNMLHTVTTTHKKAMPNCHQLYDVKVEVV